jgi:multidrug resistance efflux pump
MALVVLNGCQRGPLRETAAAAAGATVTSPAASPASADPGARVVRSTGVVQAEQSHSVRTPQITGQNARVTLTRLIPNGTRVHKDDVLVEFDRTNLLDEEREARAKLDDLGHQLNEKKAQIRSDAAQRASKIKEAEADLAKARLQLRKGPILAELDRMKNEALAASSERLLKSLRASGAIRDKAETAAIRILELKQQRQQVTVDRLRANLDRLVIKSPQDGMVALENTWKAGSMGPPQEGDQLWPGQPVLRIFDPTSMIVETMVNEPDVAVLGDSVTAKVYLDAYPTAVFTAKLESASPVATAGLESPVRTFTARFRIAEQDPRLLPDLSASMEIALPAAAPKGAQP